MIYSREILMNYFRLEAYNQNTPSLKEKDLEKRVNKHSWK